jgi:O-antigen ligase
LTDDAKIGLTIPEPATAPKVESHPSRRGALNAPNGHRFEGVLLFGLIAGLAWSPLWLGGDRPFPWGVNAIIFPGLVIVYEVSVMFAGRRHPFSVARILPSAVLFMLVLAWIAMQMSPWASGTFAHPIWVGAADVLQRDPAANVVATITVNASQTFLALVRLLTDASVFWLALQLGRKPRAGLSLLSAILAIVAVYSAIGLALAIFEGGNIPFASVPTSGSFVRSTFGNRNSFATYAGLGLIVGIALVLRLYRHNVPEAEGFRGFRIGKFLEVMGREGALLLSAAIVILVALLGTLSRGGVLATAAGLFALLALGYSRNRRDRGEGLDVIAFIVAVLVALFLGFGDRFLGRIASVGLEDASRLSVDAIVLRAIQDAPLLGFGYGTFADVFPMYRDQSISPFGVWDMGHNTYLEVLLGLGVLGGSALIAALGLLLLKCLFAAVRRRRNATAPLVATSAGILVGLHALVDFSLQIEAVAITFMALLGAGVAQSEGSTVAVSD